MMTEDNYKFVGHISRTVGRGFTQSYVSLFTTSGPFFGFFVRLRTGELALPAHVGGKLSLTGENLMPIMAAFPARLGTSDGLWLNLYPECEVTDLSEMPPDNGLLEAMPHKSVKLNGLRQVGCPVIPFVVTNSGVLFEDIVYDRIEIAYRCPTNPSDIPGLPAGAVPKGSGDGSDPRSYGPAHSFGVIHIRDRAELARQLAEEGIELDPNVDRDWSKIKLDELGLRLENIELDLVTA